MRIVFDIHRVVAHGQTVTSAVRQTQDGYRTQYAARVAFYVYYLITFR